MKVKITLDNGDIVEATNPEDMAWLFKWRICMPNEFTKIGDTIVSIKHIVSITKVGE